VVLRSLNLEGMTLETNWPARKGEAIHLVIEAPESKRQLRLNGRVVQSRSVEEDSERFSTQVRFDEKDGATSADTETESPGTPGSSIADAVDGLLAEIITAHPESPRVDPSLPFCGRLSQVSLPNLLGFFESESVSGILKLTHKDKSAQILIRQGRVIDARGAADPTDPIGNLRALIEWHEALFEFTSQEVQGDDRLQMPIASLLACL
jgi:hypothetical protein